MFNFLKKVKCKHDYEYLDKDIPNTTFYVLHKKESYVFKCKNCGNIRIIENYYVVEKIINIFMKLLNEEMSKPKNLRVSNCEFMNRVWDSYSDDSYINKTLRTNINVEPIMLKFREIRAIDDSDILSLDFVIAGARIKSDIFCDELEDSLRFVIVRDKKGKLNRIRKMRLEIDIEDEIKTLKSRYLRKGIKKDYETLKEQAIVNVCNYYGILYNRNH